MKIPVKMAIVSHLSDAQELLHTAMETISVSRGVADTKSTMVLSKSNFENVNMQINFAKLLILTYPNIDTAVEDNELDNLWKEIVELKNDKEKIQWEQFTK